MVDEFSRWLEYAEWRGQTVQALKDITCELKELKSEISKTKDTLQSDYNKKSERLREDISRIRDDNRKRDIRTAEIAGGTSMLIVMLGWIISSIL